MKRIAFFIILALSILNLSAQKASLNKAYNAYYEKNFVKAKEAIDLCTIDPKLSVKAQTWLYKGNIYFYLANQEYGEKQQNMEYKVIYPNSPVDAFDAFTKTLEIDKKIKQLQEEKSKIGDEYSKLLNENTYPEGELFVKLDAPNAGSFVFEISYTASNASWTPMYDIVAKDTNKPIELVYKAEVKQNTKEDWKDVKVRLSSSNPQKIKGKTKVGFTEEKQI